MDSLWQDYNSTSTGVFQLPESPRKPMEFLSRSWSDATLQVSNKPLHSPPSKTAANCNITAGEMVEESAATLVSGNTFSFASSATSQLVLERIMSQSVTFLLIFVRLIFLKFVFLVYFSVLSYNKLINNKIIRS